MRIRSVASGVLSLLLPFAACSPTDSSSATDSVPTTTGGTTDDSTGTTTGTATTDTAAETVADPTTIPTTGEVGPPPVDYVIVAADPLADAAAGFAAHRSAGGHTVALVRMSEILADGGDPVEAIRERLRGYHAPSARSTASAPRSTTPSASRCPTPTWTRCAAATSTSTPCSATPR